MPLRSFFSYFLGVVWARSVLSSPRFGATGWFYQGFSTSDSKRCKGVHCVDLGESFPTHILLQNLASIQLRTNLSSLPAPRVQIPQVMMQQQSAAAPTSPDQSQTTPSTSLDADLASTMATADPAGTFQHQGRRDPPGTRQGAYPAVAAPLPWYEPALQRYRETRDDAGGVPPTPPPPPPPPPTAADPAAADLDVPPTPPPPLSTGAGYLLSM